MTPPWIRRLRRAQWGVGVDPAHPRIPQWIVFGPLRDLVSKMIFEYYRDSRLIYGGMIKWQWSGSKAPVDL